MIHERTLQDRAKEILNTWLTPALRSRGFRKKGRIHTCSLTDVVHVLDIQQSPYNKKDKLSFALNLGVYIPGVWAHAHHTEEPKVVDSPFGILQTRPGLVMIPKGTQWWDLKATDDPEKDREIGADLNTVILEGAFRRFFDRFQYKKDVAEFLLAPRQKEDKQVSPQCESQGVIYAGIIWDQLGEYDKCRAAMAKAAELAKGKRLEADIESFALAYECGKLRSNGD